MRWISKFQVVGWLGENKRLFGEGRNNRERREERGHTKSFNLTYYCILKIGMAMMFSIFRSLG
jgi:hypothetical protein